VETPIQQVILPESRTLYPGLSIETEYRPAREVGGDFFQILPHPTDGSTLIVTGKGLQAGMLVALLVGTIRSTAELTSSQKLVIVSDGILEATDADGKLFGFDRVAELLRNSTPVKALADAAQLFGQNDDISLVAVTRTT
jgi:serine phosphatase RsbU (regulator of sigma subunit)